MGGGESPSERPRTSRTAERPSLQKVQAKRWVSEDHIPTESIAARLVNRGSSFDANAWRLAPNIVSIAFLMRTSHIPTDSALQARVLEEE